MTDVLKRWKFRCSECPMGCELIKGDVDPKPPVACPDVDDNDDHNEYIPAVWVFVEEVKK